MAASNNKRPQRGTSLRSSSVAPLLFLLASALALCRCRSHESGVDQTDNHRSNDAKVAHLHDTMFPYDWLDGAWESHPILATGRIGTNNATATALVCTAEELGCTEVGEGSQKGNNAIATAFLPPNDDRLEIVESLFTLDDLGELLSRRSFAHVDGLYHLPNDNVLDGKRVPESFHIEYLALKDIMHAVERNGYSLVLNAMQERWAPLTRFSRSLFDGVYVTCNLYLTPSAAKDDRGKLENDRPRALHMHFDEMDAFIVQLAGRKLWSVAKRPSMYLPYSHEQRDLTEEEVHLLASEAMYDDFMLRPGDVLYIPRGFAHNASTVSPDGEYGGSDGKEERLQTSPSMHVTLGIQGCLITVEALVHYAIHAYFTLYPEKDSIVIRKRDCAGSKHNVKWGTVLHLYLSAVARGGDGCKEGEGICGLFRKNILRRPSSHGKGDMFDESMQEIYIDAVEAYTEFPLGDDSVQLLIDFANRLQESQEYRSGYCFPAMEPSDFIACPQELHALPLREQLAERLSDLRSFALDPDWYEAVESIATEVVMTDLESRWRQDKEALSKSGYAL